MNYIREINAFMDWLEINPLDPTTQTLWFHIMAIANKSGWPEWFTIANLTLMAKVGVSENTLIKHRNILIQKNRIEYKSQGKHKAGKYKIIPFTSFFEVKDTVKDNVTSNIAANHEVNREVNREVNHAVNPSALYKLNKTKRNNNGSSSGATQTQNYVELLNQEFGRLASPIELEKLQAFIVDDGLDPLVVCEAIKRARLQGYTNVSYVLGILRNWRDAGVKDMSGVSRYELEYEKNRQMVSKRKIKDTNSFDNETEQQKRDKYKALYLS